jgi:hypothetical protein
METIITSFFTLLIGIIIGSLIEKRIYYNKTGKDLSNVKNRKTNK